MTVFFDEGGPPGSEGDDLIDSARNPFSTRFVQPGAIPYFFEAEFIEKIKRTRPDFYIWAFAESMREKTELSTWIGCRFLGEIFASSHYRGQIIGPHGSGKSTLTKALSQVFERTGTSIFSFVLHNGTGALPAPFEDGLRSFAEEKDAALGGETAGKKVVFLDGYEQLSPLNKIRLRRLCRRHRLGLLITSHRRQCGFPILMRTAPSLETLRKIVDYLLDESKILPGNKPLAELYSQRRDNFRDILFSLYDWFEEADRR